jgi:single-strand DNA-binding protein
MGHLTADPEVKTTPAGDSVASFTLGVNYTRGGKNRAEFFDCEVWLGWGLNLAKTAKKGSLVLISGRLKQEQWKDPKTKKTRSRVRIVAERAFHVEAKYAGSRGKREPGEEDVPY